MGWYGEIEAWSWLSARNFLLSEIDNFVLMAQTVDWYTGFRFSSSNHRRAIIPTSYKCFGEMLADDGETPPLPWTRRLKSDETAVYKHPGDLDAEFCYPVLMPNVLISAKNPQQTPLLFFSALRAWLYGARISGCFRQA